MRDTYGNAIRIAVVALALGCFLAYAFLIMGCKLWSRSDGYEGERHDAITSSGIYVDGPDAAILAPMIEVDYQAVAKCWGMSFPRYSITVTIKPCAQRDSRGNCGILGPDGKTLGYGWAMGRDIWVPEDLRALKHEFSHVMRPDLSNSDGQCWL